MSNIFEFPSKESAFPKTLTLQGCLALDKGIVSMASYTMGIDNEQACSFFIKIEDMVCFYQFDPSTNLFHLEGAIAPGLPDSEITDGIMMLLYEGMPNTKNVRIWSRD